MRSRRPCGRRRACRTRTTNTTTSSTFALMRVRVKAGCMTSACIISSGNLDTGRGDVRVGDGVLRGHNGQRTQRLFDLLLSPSWSTSQMRPGSGSLADPASLDWPVRAFQQRQKQQHEEQHQCEMRHTRPRAPDDDRRR
jgi:hypothetical protein